MRACHLGNVSSLLFCLTEAWPSYKIQSLPRTEEQMGEGMGARELIPHAGNGKGTQEARRIDVLESQWSPMKKC